MAKKKVNPTPLPIKKAVSLSPISERYIELSNPVLQGDQALGEAMKWYGGNIHLELVDELSRKENAVILVPDSDEAVGEKKVISLNRSDSSSESIEGDVPSDPILVNPSPLSSVHVKIDIDELNFRTGNKGERLFFGFRRGEENSYNAGKDINRRNEFPLRVGDFASWFPKEFNDENGSLTAGLELGHEINFDAIVAGGNLKHAEYKARMGLRVQYEDRFGKIHEDVFTVKGYGFFFDFTGHMNYQGADYMLGVLVARKAALYSAFQKLLKVAVSRIAKQISASPLFVQYILGQDGRHYISAGENYSLQPGQRFYDVRQYKEGASPCLFTVSEIFRSISRVVIQGNGCSNGDELASLEKGAQVPQPQPVRVSVSRSLASVEHTYAEIDAGRYDVPMPEEIKKFQGSAFTDFLKRISDIFTLPYRIWRYFQYDQKYEGGELWVLDQKQAESFVAKSKALQMIGAINAWKAFGLGSNRTVIALIDSGVDYNHPELRRNIFFDGLLKSPGWDFISGDRRPFDDHAHGTEIASVIAGGGVEMTGMAPGITLLPLKVFSPYGITNSASIYSAFEYAVKNRAKIIVLAWASLRPSQALEEAMELARAKGILVVTTAGDYGQDLNNFSFYPASYAQKFENMIVVAAESNSGRILKSNPSASNFGGVTEIAAPGEDILVARPRDNYITKTYSGLAVGYVAGALGLIWSHCEELGFREVKKLLFNYGSRINPRLNNQVIENKELFFDQITYDKDRICN